VRQLVFVHGRAQEFKDSVALKQEWVEALRSGLRACGRDLPIAEDDIRFPYYGQTLHDLVSGADLDDAARVIVRGEDSDQQQQEFASEYLRAIRERFEISDAQVREVGGQEALERGPLNWEWVQAGLRALDRYVPGASAASVAVATNDVYKYLTNAGLQNVIDHGVRSAFADDRESVVVSHSLGTVVAYNVLQREGRERAWRIPLLVTLGSPLGVQVIKQRLSPVSSPHCVGEWFNALDPRDVVALYPLDSHHFPVSPSVENKTDVDNPTPNRHGISGYLSDPEVARRIHEALTKP